MNPVTWEADSHLVARTRITADDDGLTIRPGIAASRHYAWSEILRADWGEGRETQENGLLSLTTPQRRATDPDYLYAGGPWVRITSTGSHWRISHPDPEALIRIIRAQAPHALIGTEEDEEPTEWTTTKSGLSPDAAEQRVRFAAVLCAVVGFIAVGSSASSFGGGMGSIPVVAAVLGAAFLLWVLAAARYLHTVRLIMVPQGVQVRVEPWSTQVIRWSQMREIRVREEGEFSWARRDLGVFLPGQRTYVGGRALQIVHATGAVDVSLRNPEEAARALEAGRNRAAHEG